MNNNMMELNLNEMEKVNGGFDWVKAVVWGTVGATVGAGVGASVGGIPGRKIEPHARTASEARASFILRTRISSTISSRSSRV